MRVVHLSTSDFGGAAIAAINLHRALLEQDLQSHLLTLGRTRNDIPAHTCIDPFELGGWPLFEQARFKLKRVLEKTGLREDRDNQPGNRYLQNRPPGHEIFSLPYSWFDVLQHPIVRRAELIHLHWVSYGLIDVERFFKACDRPVVWTMHDMNPFTGGCHHADDSRGYQKACQNCTQLADPARAHGWWQAKARGFAAFPKGMLAAVAPSQWLADQAMASTLLHDRPVQVIPNGFDTHIFHPVDRMEARRLLGLPSDTRIVLFNAFDVGGLRKGMPLLIPALQTLADRPVLLCLGARPPGLELENARFSGYVTDQDRVALHYSAADLFVLPSQAENLPNTISESLLCGTPVVAFHVGGIPEQVDATNGIVVRERSVAALAEAISVALAREWDSEAIAARARARYDQRLISTAYRDLYASMRP